MGRLRSALETLGVAAFFALLIWGFVLYALYQSGQLERVRAAIESPYPPPPPWPPSPAPLNATATTKPPPPPLVSTWEEVLEGAAIINGNRTAAGLPPLKPAAHDFALMRARQVLSEPGHCFAGLPADVWAARSGFYWPFAECAAQCFFCRYYMLANAARAWLDSTLHRMALHWGCATHLVLARYSRDNRRGADHGAVALAVANYSLWDYVKWENGTLVAAGVTRARPPYDVVAFKIERCFRWAANATRAPAEYGIAKLPGGLYRVEVRARWEPPGPGFYALWVYGRTENGWCPIGAYALAYKLHAPGGT